MNKLTKVVNIYPSMPITGINPPIRSAVKRVTKSIDEIRICLMARAIVEEILSDGKTIRLNIGNYDKCNNVNKDQCGCGCGCGGWKPVETNPVNTTNTDETVETKSPWKIAYDKALEGKDLASMTRKQRRSAEAAAKAIADAAVAGDEPEVIMGVGSVETTEELVNESETTEEIKETVEETAEVQEEEVKTADIEEVANVTE